MNVPYVGPDDYIQYTHFHLGENRTFSYTNFEILTRFVFNATRNRFSVGGSHV